MMMMIETKIMIGTLGSKVRFTNIRQQGSNNYYMTLAGPGFGQKQMLKKKGHFDVKHSITFLHSCPRLPPPIVHVLGYLARQGANYPPQKGVALCIYMYSGLTREGGGDLARRTLK